MDTMKQFTKSISEYLTSIIRYSCYAQNYKKNLITSIELKFNDSNELKNILNQNWGIFKNQTCKNKDLKEYPYGDCKTSIEYRDIAHESIYQRIDQFINSINNPSIEYNIMESSKKFQCYVIKTTNSAGKAAYFITKKSPIRTYKNHTRMFILKDDSYILNDKPMLTLSTIIDAIIFEGKIYFASLNLESFLGLETYAAKQKECCISNLEQVLSQEEFNEFKEALRKKNSRSYKSFNESRLANLKDPQKRKTIAQKLNITQNKDGTLNLTNEKAKNHLLLYLLNKIAIDVDDEKQNLASNIPLERI